jgi:hypothetical protein
VKRIIIGDETRVYGYNVEKQIQSSQWVGKFRRGRDRDRDRDGFLDIEGVVHYEFLRLGQTVNGWYYLEVLKRLRENVRGKSPLL